MTKQELDDLMAEFNKKFEEMDKAFKAIDERIMGEDKWKPYTLILPKRIGGRWYWPGRKVYRRFTLSPGGGFYKYGTEFDVLKDT